MNILETERLSLRELTTETDAAFILDLLNEPGFIQNIADRGVRTLEQANAYILNGPSASYAHHGFGLWRVALKATDEPIGICGLIKRDVLDDVDLGYAFLERYWGQGFASEAAQAVKEYARGVVGLKRLVAVVNPDNEKSVRVLEKLGMRYESLVRLAESSPEIKLYGLDFD